MEQYTLKESEARGNVDYIVTVNSLIPQAVKAANKKTFAKGSVLYKIKTSPRKDGGNYNHCMWTEYFHAEMAKLTRESGIRR